MKKLLAILFILVLINCKTKAQNTDTYGQVSKADLLLKDCDFEKGASAMLLFDKEEVNASWDSIAINRHVRIKVLNAKGSDVANVRLPYYSFRKYETITSIEAQTINLENGKVVVSRVEPQFIYTEATDKLYNAIIFVMPQVKPGSIIEYKYKLISETHHNIRPWYFQGYMPVRYSEVTLNQSYDVGYLVISRGNLAFVNDTTTLFTHQKNDRIGKKRRWAKGNIPSYVPEPFVIKGTPNVEQMLFMLNETVSGYDDKQRMFTGWREFGLSVGHSTSYTSQFSRYLHDENELIKHAKSLKTLDEKVAFLFNEVKNTMSWNKINTWFPIDGVHEAWNKKSGNAGEINLILYNLLRKAGVTVCAMLVSTRNHGLINPRYYDDWVIDKTVVFVPISGGQFYVLDASNKHNSYNVLPLELLNTYAVLIAVDGNVAVTDMLYLNNKSLAQYVVNNNGEIKADGTVSGQTEINNGGYNKFIWQEMYDKLGVENYSAFLRNNGTKIQITDLAIENTTVDSLPLVQKFKFNLDVNESGGNYIYFNPNLFSSLQNNPFTSDRRIMDIDLVYCCNYSINGNYKLPAGYQIDVVPASMVLNMPDKSIVFKRVIGEVNGSLQVHYNINYTRSVYKANEYPELRAFYKKMYNMLNEPIVLKKI